jgi:hypothetical protein
MNKFIITITILSTSIFACKKKQDTYCYYEAMKGNTPIYTWIVYKPTTDQIQKVQDTCRCSVTIKESCVPCNGVITDQGGTDIACY